MKNKPLNFKPLTKEQEANINGGISIAAITSIIGILTSVASTINGIVQSNIRRKGEFRTKDSVTKWEDSPKSSNVYYAW
ncbi:hypothetical protein NPA07_03860 [Mycoplasmopsis caviae]|uniref:Uncharacterized protein n=1 Tax=Mycoplasmopsis caviae TaxID=55603 RepID=A0A3P8MFB6_9BACT|nr:hypothetical protein [Mycoplasmopsis caviae]UUD34920.1 hypothetical protein NPA07_03860 [Mycoplasmopsis caviae]VDR42253.1 Uncharacterised protein [Mycoplasmopsis caviae]